MKIEQLADEVNNAMRNCMLTAAKEFIDGNEDDIYELSAIMIWIANYLHGIYDVELSKTLDELSIIYKRLDEG